MAEFARRGFLGGFHGRLGDAVGAVFRGKNIIKALPRRSGKAPVQSLIDQRFKFGLVTNFMGSVDSIINRGFISSDIALTPVNLAVKQALAQAITGTSGAFKLNYSKIALSNGKLNGVLDGDVEAVAGAKIKVSWAAPSTIDFDDDQLTRLTDEGLLAVYSEDERWALTKSGIKRTDLTMTLRLPAEMVGNKVHAWVVFVALDGKQSSRTTYLGSITTLE
jgi:hypothetical protein